MRKTEQTNITTMSIIIVSMENNALRIKIPNEAIKNIRTLKDNLEDIPSVEGVETEISIPYVENQHALDLLLEYITFDIQNPIDSDGKLEHTEWETAFYAPLEAPEQQTYLFGLTMISDYLVYKRLQGSCSLKIAKMLQGKTPQQIRDTFGLPDDIPEEDKNEIFEKNGWKPIDTQKVSV